MIVVIDDDDDLVQKKNLIHQHPHLHCFFSCSSFFFSSLILNITSNKHLPTHTHTQWISISIFFLCFFFCCCCWKYFELKRNTKKKMFVSWMLIYHTPTHIHAHIQSSNHHSIDSIQIRLMQPKQDQANQPTEIQM